MIPCTNQIAVDSFSNATAHPVSVGEANGKNVVSRDPRKPFIMAALKAASGCRKVTMVQELKTGGYSGNCLNPNADGVTGFWFVPTTDVAKLMPKITG